MTESLSFTDDIAREGEFIMRLAVHPYINSFPFSPYSPGPWDNSNAKTSSERAWKWRSTSTTRNFSGLKKWKQWKTWKIIFFLPFEHKPQFSVILLTQYSGIQGLIETTFFFLLLSQKDFVSSAFCFKKLVNPENWTCEVVPEEPTNADF